MLRYGENPHQGAALYVDDGEQDTLATAEQLHGKEMSYNNYVDTDAAIRAAHDFDEACVAIIKHANPCGIAVGAAGDIAEAHRLAHECDPVSAFGGIIAANRTGHRTRWRCRSPRSSPRSSARRTTSRRRWRSLQDQEEHPDPA